MLENSNHSTVRLDKLFTSSLKLSEYLVSERDKLVRDLGLTHVRWKTLEQLEPLSSAPTVSQFARRQNTSRQALLRILRALEKLEMVDLLPCQDDQRAKIVELTPIGRDVLHQANERYEIWIHSIAVKNKQAEIQQSQNLIDTLHHDLINAGDGYASLSPSSTPSHIQAVKQQDKRSLRGFVGVQRHILNLIRNGLLVPGHKLPAERNLSKSLGLSRSAIREALRSLEMSGVLRIERGVHGGAFVRESASDGIASSINAMLILGRLPLTDLMEVRSSLIGQCARLGALRGTEEDFTKIEENIENLISDASQSKLQTVQIAPAVEFYRLTARTSHNPLMVLIVDALADLTAEMLYTLKSWPKIDGVKPRRDMLAAMRRGDADEAEHLIRSHFEETNKLFLEYEKYIRSNS